MNGKKREGDGGAHAADGLILPVAEVVRLLVPNSHEFGYGHF